MKITSFSIFCLLTINLNLLSQYLGMPRIKNFVKEDYSADAPNWATCSNSKGIMYFGNPYGLLEFDGVKWHLVARPENKSAIRSLAIDTRDRIYIGSNNEIGYCETNYRNQKFYVSLTHKIPQKYQSFGEVWDILIDGERTIFLTSKMLFIYKNNRFSIVKSLSHFNCMAKVRKQVIVSDNQLGLCYLEEEELAKLSEEDNTPGMSIRFMLPLAHNTFLMGTENELYIYNRNKVRLWESQINNTLKNSSVYCAEILPNGMLLIGTGDKGCFLTDKKGQIQYHLHQEKGLPSNSITSIYKDKNDNVWLTLFNGIAYLDLSSSFIHYGAESGLYGSVYSTAIYQNHLLVGTNQGIYRASVTEKNTIEKGKGKFKRLPSSTTAIWNLAEIDHELFVNNHLGFFKYTANGLEEVYASPAGSWDQCFIPGDNKYLIQGTYSGFLLYKKVQGEWTFQSQICGYTDNARQFAFDNSNNLWVVHGLKGVFKLRLSESYDSVVSLRFYNQTKGLPSDLYNSLQVLDGQIYFGTQKGVYSYSSEGDTILADAYYSAIFGNETIVRNIFQHNEKRLFYISDYDNQDRVGEIIFSEDDSWQIKNWPFQSLRGKFIPAFEEINYLDNKTILFGLEDGIALYRKSTKSSLNKLKSNITHVYVTKPDSLIYGDAESEPDYHESQEMAMEKPYIHELPYNLNDLKFQFAAASYEVGVDIYYQTYLEGWDNNWTRWTADTEREFTNLPAGKYVFRIKAKDTYGTLAEQDAFHFSILPPWYKRKALLVAYTLFFFCSIFILYGRQKKLIEKEKATIEQRFKQDLISSEKRVIELENELLTAANKTQESDLASTTMQLVKLNEALVKIKSHLEEITGGKNTTNDLHRICSFIDDTINDKNSTKNFELHFNKAHDNFLQRLKNQYPKLSNRDLRLCAYLRMNISSKEIAPLMGITFRSVEAQRYRLRKKLMLGTDKSLSDFILGY